jgi:DNA-binding CsgD family transcriptional regulator
MNQLSSINPTDAIILAFEQDQIEVATRLFVQSGGDLFAFNYGYEDLGRVLEAMPDGIWRHHETLLGAYILFLAKQGRAGRAQAHLDDPELSFEPTYRSETYRLMLAIHLGDPVSPEQLDQWIAIERRLPLSDPLREGLYYNCILVFLVRHGRIKDARVAARRAISAYRDAHHSYLEHFIYLHLADVSLLEGHLREARRLLGQAEKQLAASGKAYGNELHVIEILKLALDYETGQFEHIPDRAAPLRDALMTGDCWVEIFEQLARISVKSTFFRRGRDAALSELEQFRTAYAHRHGGSSEVLSVLEISIDRLDWHFGDVEVALTRLDGTKLKSPIARTLLSDVLISDATSAPQDTETANPRKMIVSRLEDATTEKGHPRRRHVEQALWMAVKESHLAPFIEHRDVLSGIGTRLSTGRFARGHVQLARFARRTVKTVEQTYWIPDPLRQENITQRQFRIVTALQSGATNKEIARALAISEATVKYHLARLYKTFDVKRRGELLETLTKK